MSTQFYYRCFLANLNKINSAWYLHESGRCSAACQWNIINCTGMLTYYVVMRVKLVCLDCNVCSTLVYVRTSTLKPTAHSLISVKRAAWHECIGAPKYWWLKTLLYAGKNWVKMKICTIYKSEVKVVYSLFP